eukprot:1394020-Amorphochlora_amoeboformis.AAC.1
MLESTGQREGYVRSGLGSDYSACLSPRTIDSSREWGCIAVWDNSTSVRVRVRDAGFSGVSERVDFRGKSDS